MRITKFDQEKINKATCKDTLDNLIVNIKNKLDKIKKDDEEMQSQNQRIRENILLLKECKKEWKEMKVGDELSKNNETYTIIFKNDYTLTAKSIVSNKKETLSFFDFLTENKKIKDVIQDAN